MVYERKWSYLSYSLISRYYAKEFEILTRKCLSLETEGALPANFGWSEARARIVKSAMNATGEVGYILQVRRLFLGKTQGSVAEEASLLMRSEGAIPTNYISKLEDGVLLGVLKGPGYIAIDAVLEVLQWKQEDREFIRHMLYEFARIV